MQVITPAKAAILFSNDAAPQPLHLTGLSWIVNVRAPSLRRSRGRPVTLMPSLCLLDATDLQDPVQFLNH
jgi:hypothetical protein